MNITDMPLAELQRQLASRALSAETVARAFIERVESQEASVRAWEFFDADLVLRQAQQLDQGPVLGPLHGIPLGVKDLMDTGDMPTTYGSPIYAGHRPARDAACVAASRAAGAIVMGKTVTTEFATYKPGKTRNPRGLPGDRTPGGSSSGSAAAVAAGMVPAAFGTQTAGSIIRPAAYCGVVGYKPTYNSLAPAGVKMLAPSLDTVGVIARDVETAALVVGSLARLSSTGLHPASSLRIGICHAALFDRAGEASRRAVAEAIALLKATGAQVVDIDLPSGFNHLNQAQMDIMAYEAVGCFAWERAHKADQFSPAFAALQESGLAVDGERFREASLFASAVRLEIESGFQQVDVLLAPSAEGEAPAGLESTGDPVFNRSWSLLGNPCVHVPVTHGPAGMPVGVTLIGPRFGDAKTLSAAALLQAAVRRTS